jgi:hypothetical protein
MKCCICGAVKNVAQYLDKIFENIEKIGTLFDEYVIILAYDNSSDDTLQKIKNYQLTHPNKLFLYVNKIEISRFRTIRLAYARNCCLELIKSQFSDYEMFIMMDCDDVCSNDVNLNVLNRNLRRNDWDALSFNKSYYYDIWALSIRPYVFSYNHFNNFEKINTNMNKYITELIKKIPPGKLLKCMSAFNGFSIYRTRKFINCNYDGRPRPDLIPIPFLIQNMKVNKSPIVYKTINTNEVFGKYEDCEHRVFHLDAIRKNGARIRISPEIVF